MFLLSAGARFIRGVQLLDIANQPAMRWRSWRKSMPNSWALTRPRAITADLRLGHSGLASTVLDPAVRGDVTGGAAVAMGRDPVTYQSVTRGAIKLRKEAGEALARSPAETDDRRRRPTGPRTRFRRSDRVFQLQPAMTNNHRNSA